MSDRLTDFYSKYYKSEKHDSPDLSRTSMARRIVRVLETGIPGTKILNIGSGPQALEKQLVSAGWVKLHNYNFLTIDIADIPPHRLLGRKKRNIMHTRGNALELPYPAESIALVVSNHAIDFLPRVVFGEVYRVLQPDARAIFYFHHPDMLPDDLSTVRNEQVRQFWKYLRDTDKLFVSENQIAEEMQGFGFNINEIMLNSDGRDKWWEVDLGVK